MKKIFRILFLIIISSQLAFAQGSDPVFHFGLKAVPNLGWIKTDDTDTKSDGSKFGFAYGLVTEFRFAENYAFATGIEVAYRNAKTKSNLSSVDTATALTTTVNDASSLKIQYLEIPLTLKLKTNEIGYFRYYLQIGVAPGFKLRARADRKTVTQITNAAGTIDGSSTEEQDNLDIKGDINNLNMSMIIAGGVEYNISGNTNLLLGLVFNNGFSDIADGDFNAKSNYLGLSIGILF
jgi:opacity protein-like surface antigen